VKRRLKAPLPRLDQPDGTHDHSMVTIATIVLVFMGLRRPYIDA
jgi:hypothetical protein